jgi:hypothetical protein
VLHKFTFVALFVNTLAYASELLWLGLDQEVSIVVGVLVGAAALVATGWRWTPALGGLLAGAILLGNPFLLVNLANVSNTGFFVAALVQAVSGLAALLFGCAATIQNYRRPTARQEIVQ